LANVVFDKGSFAIGLIIHDMAMHCLLTLS